MPAATAAATCPPTGSRSTSGHLPASGRWARRQPCSRRPRARSRTASRRATSTWSSRRRRRAPRSASPFASMASRRATPTGLTPASRVRARCPSHACTSWSASEGPSPSACSRSPSLTPTCAHTSSRSAELRGRGLSALARQGLVKAHARADPELGEHLPEVPFDGARAEEQLGADLGVSSALSCQPCDVRLLRRQLVARLVAALAHRLAGGQQLTACAFGEPVGAHRREHLVRRAQLRTRIAPAVLTAQPLAVEQMAARELGAEPPAAQPVNRFAIEAVGCVALAQQRPGTRLEPEPPVPVAAVSTGREPRESLTCQLRHAGP